MKARAVVVFSGYNNRAVLAFVRTLESLQVEYYIVACDKNDPIFHTSYREKVAATRKIKSLEESEIKLILEFLVSQAKKELLIAPSTEALNRFLFAHNAIFKELGCIIPLVHKSLYEAISDKKPFSEMCNRHGISVPHEYSDARFAPIPFVAKPKSYFDRLGKIFCPQIIDTDAKKVSFLEENDTSSYYFQRFISGGSYYLLYYLSQEGRIFKLSQENLIQQPNGKSIIAAISSDIHKKNLSVLFEAMLLEERFYGLIMIEIKEDNDDYFMIEANPRFWGPSQLFVDNGFNLFIPFLVDHDVIDSDELIKIKENENKTRYFWGEGINRYNELSFHNYSNSQFIVELDKWNEIDVYFRKDVINRFGKN